MDPMDRRKYLLTTSGKELITKKKKKQLLQFNSITTTHSKILAKGLNRHLSKKEYKWPTDI